MVIELPVVFSSLVRAPNEAAAEEEDSLLILISIILQDIFCFG